MGEEFLAPEGWNRRSCSGQPRQRVICLFGATLGVLCYSRVSEALICSGDEVALGGSGVFIGSLERRPTLEAGCKARTQDSGMQEGAGGSQVWGHTGPQEALTQANNKRLSLRDIFVKVKDFQAEEGS